MVQTAFRRLSSLALAAICTLSLVWGQGVTTATIVGKVVGSGGAPLTGATIIAKHEPSGTTYGAFSREDGRYTMPGLRVGGPYTVTVNFEGYKPQASNNIFLSLGQVFDLPVTLTETSSTTAVVEISAESNPILNGDRTGAATNIGKEQIEAMPTLSRSIIDFARMTPQASSSFGSLSFAGQDNRYNNIAIDGSLFNNSFGLSGLPGGQTNSTPISLDAIQEIQVNLAPFDVRQGGFMGAGINAITRQGTNSVEASVFFNNRNQTLVGRRAAAETDNVITNNFEVNQYGFRVGGPIIKDKLFFFVNAEVENRVDPATSYLAAASGRSGSNVTRVRASMMDSIASIMKTKYNYDPGVYENFDLLTKSTKALARLDYNISSKHKASVRFNMLESVRDVPPSNSGSISGNRTNTVNALAFSNAYYVINNNIYSAIGELNSTLNSRMSNNMIFGFTANRDFRAFPGDNQTFPLVDILDAGTTLTTFGNEPFTPNNRLNTDTWQFQDNFTYYLNRNTVTAGVNFEKFKFVNTFTPNYHGQYVFNSFDDFYNHVANGDSVGLRRFQLQYSALPGGALPTTELNTSMLGLYVQDEFNATNNLKLTGGIRIDAPMYGNIPAEYENKTIADYKFLNPSGDSISLSTTELPSTNLLISPRFGFNWDVKGDKSLQVRGGSGMFAGRPAFVWISNQLGNNGVQTGQTSVDNTNTDLYPLTGQIPTEANPQTPSSFNLAVTEEGFKFPQLWRTDLAADVKLPFGIIASGELILDKNINNVTYYNANLEAAQDSLPGPDNRPKYGSSNNNRRIHDNVTDATVLTNTKKGSGYNVTAKLERPLNIKAESKYNWGAMIAYNFGSTKDVMSAGSIAFNSWRDMYSVNGNNLAGLSFSNNDQRHRLIASATYRIQYDNDGATSFSLFMEARNQGRASYYANGDLNSDGITANDLLYVPTDSSEMNFEQFTGSTGKVYTIAQQKAAYETYIQQDDYLNGLRGKYAERNGLILPWVARFDFSVQREFNLTVGGKRNTLQLRADIFNVGNLFNNKWGVGDALNAAAPVRFSKFDGTTGIPVFRMTEVNGSINYPTYRTSNTLSDVWQMQVGVRYIFN